MQQVAAGVTDLKKVLSNVKTRGILGEIQLGAILEEILSPEQYDTNVATRPGSDERVEYAVKLPGSGDAPVYLPIDAKFPGDTYAALRDAYDSGSKEAVDAAAAEKWTAILQLWHGSELTINEEILPDGLPDTDELCLVALGFQLNPDGSMKEELIQRLETVKRSAEKYPNALIVCTGGGTARDNPSATEAGAMAKWLRENGVEAGRIVVENQSQTTAQNAIYTLDLLEKNFPEVSRLAIISSDYHIETGKLLFGAQAILRDRPELEVISNAAWKAPSGTLSPMFQAGALIELLGDRETAYNIYMDNYDIHDILPPD
jgi:hypothetical protein